MQKYFPREVGVELLTLKSKDNNKNNMEGTPPLTGRALPNLINAVKMLKSKSKSKQCGFDFKILTALKGWVGLAPQGPGALHIHNYRPCALHNKTIHKENV